jgi:Trk-type K+ transport system membrane component
LSNFAKVVLALSMVLGRLEILIALSVMSSALNRD